MASNHAKKSLVSNHIKAKQEMKYSNSNIFTGLYQSNTNATSQINFHLEPEINMTPLSCIRAHGAKLLAVDHLI